MLKITSLTKTIDGETVLKNINFELHKGSIVGLLGRNGAGKTTLLRTMVGIIDPDQGDVLYQGKSIYSNPEVKRYITYMPDSTNMLKHYTIGEIIRLYKAIYPHFDEKYLLSLLKRYKLPQTGSLRRFSKGMKALFFMILTFATRAEIIMMDEPTNGLDPVIKRSILKYMIEEVAEREITLIISTHQLSEIEAMVDTLLMIKQGEIVAQTSLDQLKGEMKKLQIGVKDGQQQLITTIPGVQLLNHTGRVLTIIATENANQVFQQIAALEPLLLEEIPLTLEDIYVSKLGGELDVF